jgi:hypothetical protein
MSAEKWVIEYVGAFPPCWIVAPKGNAQAFDVTYQIKLAQRFTNREDTLHEMLRLGLSGAWAANRIRVNYEVIL